MGVPRRTGGTPAMATTTALLAARAPTSRWGGRARPGSDCEANGSFYFLAGLAEAGEGPPPITYGIGGEAQLPGRRLDGRSGYEGPRPVRRGKAAYGKNQHPVWGAIVD